MEQSREGQLIIVSGPSGVGKGTVNKILIARNADMCMSVSATTRARRPGEIEGVHYFFKTQQEFEQMIAQDAFLEYMRVFGMNYYGTPKAYVRQERQKGRDVLLEIDVQGGMRVKQVCPDAILIFIAPPSMEELRSRLVGRGTETPEAVKKRFATAGEEMNCLLHYDYVVVNDQPDIAAHKIETIVAAEKCRVARSQDLFKQFLTN